MKGWDKGVVLLCGIPGCGKTATGGVLAHMLGVPFLDLDDEIAARAGKSIAAIFADDGEAIFRELEAEVLEEILSGNHANVVALGGGTLESEEVRQMINHTTPVLVWLQVDALEAARRLEGAGLVDERPLLSELRGNLLSRRLQDLLDERSANYSRSVFAVATDGLSPVEVALRIVELLAAT